jgi:hypothetical protein
MSFAVSLRDFVNEMDTFDDEWRVFLNRRTGEFLTTSPEDRAAVEGEDDADLSTEERELLPKVREAMSSDDWLLLPSKFELNEYRIMERFCGTIADATLSADLRDTIGGRGTFGRFKNMVHRHNLQEAWYRFRDEALREIAVEWLEAHTIPYRD